MCASYLDGEGGGGVHALDLPVERVKQGEVVRALHRLEGQLLRVSNETKHEQRYGGSVLVFGGRHWFNFSVVTKTYWQTARNMCAAALSYFMQNIS